jgi:hypothetical protein
VNTGASFALSPQAASERVLGIQRKLHKWASDDQDRGFSDLHNLVCDPATLLVAWRRVRGNRGSRSAGIDGQTAYEIETRHGVERFLGELREEFRAGTFRPLAVKERAIPKRSGKLRYLGSRRSATALFRPPSSWCWNRSSRSISAVLLRVSARTPNAGRARRDPALHLPLLRVDRGGRHRGVL